MYADVEMGVVVASAEPRTCKTCGTTFGFNNTEKAWCDYLGNHKPTHCKPCIDIRKKEAARC